MVHAATGGGEDTGARIETARFDALLFDLDGVITQSMGLHADSWRAMFDEFLAHRAEEDGRPQPHFDIESDYRNYVDGKPRYDGVRAFLESRDIALPQGDPTDPPEALTICGLGNRKNVLFQELLTERGAKVYPASVALLHTARAAGMFTAVVSSSKNCLLILEKAGLVDLFHVRVDGTHVEAQGMPGKPAPDMFLQAARQLDVPPERAVVFEDALSGVEAGRQGGFGLVVGVDRLGQAADLLAHGADVVVADLDEVALV